MTTRGRTISGGHVLLLVEHVEADPARLAAAAAAARAQHAGLDREGEPPPRLRPYLVAAALAERGLAMVRDAGAEHDPTTQHQLAEKIMADWFPQLEPFRPGIFDRHQLPRRLARRLNPRWQYRRWAMRAARFAARAEGGSRAHQSTTWTLVTGACINAPHLFTRALLEACWSVAPGPRQHAAHAS